MLNYSFRLTPPPNKPIKEVERIIEKVAHKQSFVKKLLLMREGGDSVKVHYHGIIRTSYKRSSIREFLKELCEPSLEGAEYSLKDTHIEAQDKPAHAYNYICKEGNVYVRIGYQETDIERWQKNYVAQKKEYEKKKKEQKQDKMKTIIQECSKLPKDANWEREAIRIILTIYHEKNLLPPVGFQLDKIIGRVLMSIDLETYIRNIQLTYRERGFYIPDDESSDYPKYNCRLCGHRHDELEPCRNIIKNEKFKISAKNKNTIERYI